MARYLGSRFAPGMLGISGVVASLVWGVLLEPGPELRFGDADILGCEVGGGGGAIIVGVLRPARPPKGSCEEALRLRLFCNGLWAGSLGKEWLSGGGVTGVKGLTDDIIAAIRRSCLGRGFEYIYVDSVRFIQGTVPMRNRVPGLLVTECNL